MNGPSPSSNATANAPTLKPAQTSTTSQQVAAAAAALAASRAASVSAAVRSVFGAKQQAALASAMMNASVNAAASKAAAASRANHPPRPVTTTTATPTGATTPARTPSTSTSMATSVVVMPSSFDGLPALPSHATQEDETTARVAGLACANHDVPQDGTVTLYGEPTTRAAVRAALVDHYMATNQLTTTPGDDDACGLSEMTLRMDTELEMLRRQCFAERNARWQFATPDMFVPVPVREAAWVPAPYIGPRRQTRLLRRYHEHQRVGSSSDATLGDYEALLVQSLAGVEQVRERAWPPKEFMAKSNAKPSRGGVGAYASATTANRSNSGKKKPVGMVGVVDETPLTARMCSECFTHSSALWRKRPRGTPTTTTTTATTLTAEGVPVSTAPVEEEDVCLPCFMKTQRCELFDRKAAERVRRGKEEAARAAAEARALKKQQQQMQKKIKKLQQLQQQQQLGLADDGMLDVKHEDGSSSFEAVHVKDEVGDRVLKLTRRESLSGGALAASMAMPSSSASYGMDGSAAMEDLSFVSSADDKKKREKKSKKDKKKKKKKKKKKSGDWDDSDSDDDGAASSVIMPSPPQRQMDGFVYADRADTIEAVTDHPHSENDELMGTVETVETKAKRTSHKRGASSSSKSTPSKKRKSIELQPDGETDVSSASTPTASSRGSRARTSSSLSGTAATVAAVVPTTPSASSRKRARPTKKETARERELRALGQYCPVCNMTYEEDDASPFVCCDSCEMWVHAACDTSLTPEALAALGESNDKYICPLCGGR